VYQDIIGFEEQARIRTAELRHERERYGGGQDLGLLSAIALAAGGVNRASHWIEQWATRPARIPADAQRRHRWHNS
jgi:hypothetical protein